jgi:hypothetical protein
MTPRCRRIVGDNLVSLRVKYCPVECSGIAAAISSVAMSPAWLTIIESQHV